MLASLEPLLSEPIETFPLRHHVFRWLGKIEGVR